MVKWLLMCVLAFDGDKARVLSVCVCLRDGCAFTHKHLFSTAIANDVECVCVCMFVYAR